MRKGRLDGSGKHLAEAAAVSLGGSMPLSVPKFVPPWTQEGHAGTSRTVMTLKEARTTSMKPCPARGGILSSGCIQRPLTRRSEG